MIDTYNNLNIKSIRIYRKKCVQRLLPILKKAIHWGSEVAFVEEADNIFCNLQLWVDVDDPDSLIDPIKEALYDASTRCCELYLRMSYLKTQPSDQKNKREIDLCEFIVKITNSATNLGLIINSTSDMSDILDNVASLLEDVVPSTMRDFHETKHEFVVYRKRLIQSLNEGQREMERIQKQPQGTLHRVYKLNKVLNTLHVPPKVQDELTEEILEEGRAQGRAESLDELREIRAKLRKITEGIKT